MKNVFEEVIKEMKKITVEGRSLNYGENEYGITELLQCPIKAELRRKYPEIRSEAPAIDDGFRFEYVVKNALKRRYGEMFKEEVDLPVKVGDLRIRGHLDCLIEFDDRVVGFELKAPQIILLKSLPENVNCHIIYDKEGEDRILLVNPTYKIQAKIEKFILKRMYPDKDVSLFLFQFGLCKMGTFLRKYYTCYEVEEISEEEFAFIVADFLYNRSPRYKNECEYYCPYVYVCSYKEQMNGSGVSVSVNLDSDGEVVNIRYREFLKYYRQYLELKDQMAKLESMMKKMIDGSVVIGGKEVGWVKTSRKKYDIEKVISFLKEKGEILEDWLNVTTSPKKRKLIENLLPEAVIDVEEYEVFKL